jgi:hypothetical protein
MQWTPNPYTAFIEPVVACPHITICYRRPLLLSRSGFHYPMASDKAAALLEIAAPIAETIPGVGTPLKAAFEATAKILKYAGVRYQ